ncbi:CS1 type fimbrial major subunit [Yersinia enterocolitica]
MKKTLLSIMTMAILASGSASAAPVEKDIAVEAKVVTAIKVSKDNGRALDSIKMTYDAVKNDGHFENIEKIKFASIGGTKIKVSLREAFEMNDNSNTKKFTDYKIDIGGEELIYGGAEKSFDLVNQEFSGDLKIQAKQPADAVDGEVYNGVLKLAVEAEA